MTNWPLVSFVNGLVTEGREYTIYFWTRKLLLLASMSFYVYALHRGLGRRDEHRWPLAAWLATNFAFCICMGGVWAYYYFPRYMLLGAPPAILLTVDRVPWPKAAALRALVVGAVAAACVAVALVGTQSMFELCMHVWTPRYYEQLRPLLLGN